MNIEINWSQINSKYKQILLSPKLQHLRYYRIVSSSGDVNFGTVVYFNHCWAEVRMGNDYKVFYFDTHKFYLSEE